MKKFQKTEQPKSVGVLFPSNNPKERAPAYIGKLVLQGHFIRYLALQLEESDNDQVSVHDALWLYPTHVSMELSPDYRAKPNQKKKTESKPISIQEFFADEPDEVDSDEFKNDQT
jgi:hypothetical protein